MDEVEDKSIVLFDFKFTEPYSCDTHFVITIGDRTYESDLSNWTNDFNSIRLSIEHKILTPYMKRDIELYFEDSPTIIKSYCRNWKTRGTKVTIIPNEYVQVPNLEGWCDFRQFICSLYLGLLSICMQDTDWFDAGTEGGTWECFRLATYNKLQSCLIEDFVKGISVSDFENRPRHRFITSVKEMIADYEQLNKNYLCNLLLWKAMPLCGLERNSLAAGRRALQKRVVKRNFAIPDLLSFSLSTLSVTF